MGFLSHHMLSPYLTTDCSAHFKIDTHAHSDHDRYGLSEFDLNLSKYVAIFLPAADPSGAFDMVLGL